MAKCELCGDTLYVQRKKYCERCEGMGQLVEINDFGEPEIHMCWRCEGKGWIAPGIRCPDRYKTGHPNED